MTRSVAKNRSATRPTKKGDISEATETVENTRPACVPVKCSVCVRYVVMVTYHAPQMTYWMNIMIARRVFRKLMSGPLSNARRPGVILHQHAGAAVRRGVFRPACYPAAPNPAALGSCGAADL